MVAEFANYRSWIDWVPIVSLLAMPLLFRRVPIISLAMVGAFLAILLGIYAVLGIGLGWDGIRRNRRADRAAQQD